ncbi:Deoxyribonuclease TATDN1 [Linum grandiflorum]
MRQAVCLFLFPQRFLKPLIRDSGLQFLLPFAERLFCTVGVHPTRCTEFEESGDPENHFQALLSLAKEGIQKGKVVAVGESGLDYDRLQFCSAEVQKKYFEKQFELAHTTKLPMFLHMRAAAEDFCQIMESNKYKLVSVLSSSFTGSAEESNKLLSFKNMYIGEISFLLANFLSALFLAIIELVFASRWPEWETLCWISSSISIVGSQNCMAVGYHYHFALLFVKQDF